MRQSLMPETLCSLSRPTRDSGSKNLDARGLDSSPFLFPRAASPPWMRGSPRTPRPRGALGADSRCAKSGRSRVCREGGGDRRGLGRARRCGRLGRFRDGEAPRRFESPSLGPPFASLIVCDVAYVLCTTSYHVMSCHALPQYYQEFLKVCYIGLWCFRS